MDQQYSPVFPDDATNPKVKFFKIISKIEDYESVQWHITGNHIIIQIRNTCMSNTVSMAEGNTHYTHVFIFLTGFPG